MPLTDQLDSLDIDILRKLCKDARIAYSQLAKDLKISNSLVHQRINRLKKLEVLQKAQFEINPEKLGYSTVASSGIILKESRHAAYVVKELKKIPEVVECLNVTGSYALMIKVYAKDNNHLRSILYDKIHLIKGVEGTNTIIIFNAVFSRAVPLVM